MRLLCRLGFHNKERKMNGYLCVDCHTYIPYRVSDKVWFCLQKGQFKQALGHIKGYIETYWR